MRRSIPLCAIALTFALGVDAQSPETVLLEEMTWTEVRDALASGTTTIILPTAGTEQNGPHMVLGKHRYIVEETSQRIARALGNTLVAPVLTYVPEGNLDPPSGSMRYPGSITLPKEHYMKVLEYAARSFRVGGFRDIVFIGDSGGNQDGMEEVAMALNAEWSEERVRVHFIEDYYRAHGFREWLVEQGEDEDDLGGHAGIVDTSQMLYVAPQHIRTERLAPGGGFEGSGSSGDPTKASAAYGEVGIQLKVDAALRQIREVMAER